MLFNFHKKMLENSNKMIRVGIVGASGYTGGELLRFLSTSSSSGDGSSHFTTV